MPRNRRTISVVLLAAVVLVGLGVPATAFSAGQPDHAGAVSGVPVAAQSTPTGNASGVNVTVGQQLSTIIAVSSGEVRTDFENTAFELAVEVDDDDERVDALEDRAEDLHDRAEDIREDYEDATDAYEEGDLTASAYAQRLATLNARATNLLESYEQFRERAAAIEAGGDRPAFNRTALNESIESLDAVSGTGAAALLRQFTGESEGEIEIETANGLEIEIESDDGERSREFERPRDDDDRITVNRSDALATARGALTTPENGTWDLTESELEEDDGSYVFEFELRGAPGLDGEAEVEVDGSSGEIFSLEEEIERDEEDDDDDRDDDGDGDDQDERDDDGEDDDRDDEEGEEDDDDDDDDDDDEEEDEEEDDDDN